MNVMEEQKIDPSSDPQTAEEELSLLSAYKVKTEIYEGPFDLMLAMINKGEIDLYKVSLNDIIKGFMEYIRTMQQLSISIAGEFLVMAAYLLEQKSRMLLPQPESLQQDEDLANVEEELIQRLAEYKIYKGLALSLKERKEVFQKVYTRYAPEEALKDQEYFLVDVSMKDLVNAFKRVWDLAETKETTQEIETESFSVKDKIAEISERIKSSKEGIIFDDLFTRYIKLEIICTFLAILELIKQKLIRITQDVQFGQIHLRWVAE